MYCDCGARRNRTTPTGETEWDKDCTCDLTGFVDCSDRLPDQDGEYEVRVHSTSADIYHTTATFSVKPKITERDGYFGSYTGEYHWKDFDTWDSDNVSMWRPICLPDEVN